MLYKQVANPKGIDSRNRVQRILIKIPPTFQPNQEPECYTAPAAVNVTDNSYSTALIHHHTTAAAV